MSFKHKDTKTHNIFTKKYFFNTLCNLVSLFALIIEVKNKEFQSLLLYFENKILFALLLKWKLYLNVNNNYLREIEFHPKI